MSDGPATAPVWLRAIGAVVLALLAGTALYALVIGVVNFSRIGV